jgi:hypothetical protein
MVNFGPHRYYQIFIKWYASITSPMEPSLKKSEEFVWFVEYQMSLYIPKENLVSELILVFLDWNLEFHVHVSTSGIAMGAILAQLGEEKIDHLFYFISGKLSKAKYNYTTTKREGMEIMYSLQNFKNYMLGGHFKFFVDHSTLKYLVNKSDLEGQICRWLLLF